MTQADFGAWTYALAVVAFFHGLSTLGLHRGITRFVPIYHEKEEYDKLFGTILMVLLTIAMTALVIVGGIHSSPETLARLINDKEQLIFVVLILIFMVPVEAIDGLLIRLFACFASPKAIFYRKHILGPGLKVSMVLALVLFDRSVLFLAYGWLAVNLLGVLLYIGMLIRIMSKQGIFSHFNFKTTVMPAREVFAFTIPVMTSDLVTIVMHAADTLLLGYFHNATEVAAYSVILPIRTETSVAHSGLQPLGLFA